MGQGRAIGSASTPAGESERESMVPLGIGERADTGGQDTLYPCTFSLPCIGLRFTPKPSQEHHALCPCPCQSLPLTEHLLATLSCGLLSTAPTYGVCRFGVGWEGSSLCLMALIRFANVGNRGRAEGTRGDDHPPSATNTIHPLFKNWTCFQLMVHCLQHG